MATIALAVVGAKLGAAGSFLSAIGGAVGSAIGSYIDREFFFPGPDVEQPRVGDLRAQAGSEGMPLNYAIGPECRVPGKIVYAGPRFPFIDGEGNERGSYLIDLCQGPLEEDEFVSEIYANGQLIYQEDASVNINSTLLRVDQAFQFSQTYWHIWVVAAAGGPDLSQLVTGQDCELSGWSTSENNGTWRVLATGPNPSDPTESAVRLGRFFAVGVTPPSTEVAGSSVTITQQNGQFSTSSFVNLRQYRGTYSQSPDAVVEADYGVGTSPGRYGRACIVLESLNKSKFGGTTPNFEVVLRERTAMTIAEAIDALMERAGFTAGEWDSSAVSGSFRGLVAEEPIDSKALLQALMMAHRLMAREVEGQVVFYPRTGSDTVAVAEADLAAHAIGTRPESRKVAFEDKDDAEMPSRVELSFTNSDDGLQQGSAVETHHGLQAFSEEVLRVRTPVTLSEKEAGAMARQLMVDAYAARQSRATQLPPSYLEISEGDVWTTTVDGEAITSIATRVEMGADGVVRVEGTQEQPHIQQITADEVDKEGDVNQGGGEVPLSLYLDLVLWDVAPFTDAQAQTTGIHFAYPDLGATQPYTGGALYKSTDLSLYEVTGAPVPGSLARYGVAVSGVPAAGASSKYWDYTTEIVVTVYGGWAPGNASPSAVLQGSNRAVVGTEVLGWQTATDNGDGTYTLSGLLRGLRGTPASGPSESVLVVPVEDLSFTDAVAASSLGATLGWKAVGNGWTEAQIDAIEATANLGTLKNFPVYNIRANRWESDGVHTEDDIQLTWRRQTRAVHPIFSPQTSGDGDDAPLFEPNVGERYEVDVLDALQAVVSPNSPYTINVTGGDSLPWTYTAAMASADQTASGGNPAWAPGLAKYFRVYQIGEYGRGRGQSVFVNTTAGWYYGG
jgi:hypothetical protein